MNPTAKRVLIVACAVLVGVVLIVGGASSGVVSRLVLDVEHRKDRAAADDLVRTARVPRCASASAHDISTRFEIDTGELWGTFKFQGSAFDCATQVVTPERGPRPAGLDWWPADPFPEPPATIVSIPEDRLFYAVVDSSGSRVFFWKLGAMSRPMRESRR